MHTYTDILTNIHSLTFLQIHLAGKHLRRYQSCVKQVRLAVQFKIKLFLSKCTFIDWSTNWSTCLIYLTGNLHRSTYRSHDKQSPLIYLQIHWTVNLQRSTYRSTWQAISIDLPTHPLDRKSALIYLQIHLIFLTGIHWSTYRSAW